METTKYKHVLKTMLRIGITIHIRIKLQWNYAWVQTIVLLLKLILTIKL